MYISCTSIGLEYPWIRVNWIPKHQSVMYKPVESVPVLAACITCTTLRGVTLENIPFSFLSSTCVGIFRTESLQMIEMVWKHRRMGMGT